MQEQQSYVRQLEQYRSRLTDLSQRNRTLRHLRLSTYQDMDWLALDYVEGQPAQQALARVLRGWKTPLLQKLSQQPEAQALDQHLNRLQHELQQQLAENGTYALYVGFPYVEGKFLNGAIARCPLMLVPVQLRRQSSKAPRWQLEPRQQADALLNLTFLRALAKFHYQTLPSDLEAWLPDAQAPDEIVRQLYSLLHKHDLPVQVRSELLSAFALKPFRNLKRAFAERTFTAGELTLEPRAVLGLFPQPDQALLEDYQTIAAAPGQFPLEQWLARQPASATPPPERSPTAAAARRMACLPVDGPQADALEQLRAGSNLVVQGPPGTGKSQLIVNAITEALAEGKSLLVVSQKRAALDIVHQRLRQLSLDRFTALIHDHRRDRPALYRQLAQQIGDIPLFAEEERAMNYDAWQRDYEAAAQALEAGLEEEQARYATLQDDARWGISLWQLYCQADPNGEGVDLPAATAAQWDALSLEQFLAKLEDILAYRDLLVEAHPWAERHSFANKGPADRSWMLQLLTGLAEQAGQLQQHWTHLAGMAIQAPAIPALNALGKQLTTLEQWARRLEELSEHERELLPERLQATWDARTVADCIELLETCHAHQQALELLRPDDLEATARLQSAWERYRARRGQLSAWLVRQWREARTTLRTLLRGRRVPMSAANLERLGRDCQRLAAIAQAREAFNAKAPSSLTWPTVVEAQVIAQRQASLTRLLALLPLYQAVISGSEGGLANWPLARLVDKTALQAAIDALQNWYRQWSAFEQQADQLLTPAQKTGLYEQWSSAPDWAEPIQSLQTSLEADFEALQALDQAFETLTEAEAALFWALRAQLLAHPYDWATRLRNSFYLAWLNQTEEAVPSLRAVSQRNFDWRQERLRQLQQRQQRSALELVHYRVRRHLLAQVAYNRQGHRSNYRELEHQVTKRRQIWPMLKLFERFFQEEIRWLTPCVLASPETVASVFPMQAHQFDLVLMDEASQCEVARALPVLLRGGQVALAGDEQQLQPLDLFAVRMEEAWYSEEDDPALETASILALGKLRCPTVLLNWHYRSRQSELIAFSNQHFYSKRLQPVPLPEPARSYQPAIQLHYVAGHWAAGQNAVEADELVRLVKALLQHPQQPSIGVITLNRSQRELVLERLADQHILAGMASNESPAEETLFVRNLEHVQGDERDVILISLGYAPDQQGRFKQHFGLLNQAGGENRLNVILTRARWQLHIVHSFRPEQLQVAESAQPGPRYLQTFLQQAQQGGWADSAGTGTSEGSREETTNTIATALAQAVEQLGYRVVLRPGPRQLGLDFAVYSAHNPDRCLLGVLCEGPRYFAGRSPAERSIYRYQALVARGWPLHTVYVRNYWQAPQAELQRILQKLAAESETSKP